MSKTDPRWTKEQLELARTLWLEGATAATIAAKVGKSRNSVVGKMKRLGLLNIANRPRPQLCSARRKTVKAEPAPTPVEPEPVVEFAPKNPVLLNQLRPIHCRAILGDVGPDGFAWYCGDPKAEGSSWCSHHRGLYFQPPKEKASHGQAGQRQ